MNENQNNNFNGFNNYNNMINPLNSDLISTSSNNYQNDQNNNQFEIVKEDRFQINSNKTKLFFKNQLNNLKNCLSDNFLLTSFSISKQINEQILSNIPQVNYTENNNFQFKRGRKKKDDISNRKRNKFCNDNLNHRLKTLYFQKFLITLINTKIKSCFKEQKYTIIKINSDIIKDIKNKSNLDLLNSTLGEFLSKEISIKFYKKDKHHNYFEIQKLLNTKFKQEFETILNTKLIELYNIFISNDSLKIIKNKFNFIFKCNYITLINELDESNEYKDKLKKFCLNYINFLNGER
jgi:hypothetical protein